MIDMFMERVPPPLIPGLFSIQDKEKVLKLWKTELLPIYLTGVVFLENRF